MIKIDTGGDIQNMKGESKELIINALSGAHLKNTIIGTGIVMVGIIYIAITSFLNGARAFEQAEYDALEELGIFKN